MHASCSTNGRGERKKGTNIFCINRFISPERFVADRAVELCLS
jgi:hypothetical protein